MVHSGITIRNDVTYIYVWYGHKVNIKWEYSGNILLDI
jgi:hypothetical protein